MSEIDEVSIFPEENIRGRSNASLSMILNCFDHVLWAVHKVLMITELGQLLKNPT